MRVISGIRKGHKLKVPKGDKIRPTEDKVKESLFNILGPIDENSLVLDLFAGSGSIGIEFLSRGAKKVYFIDRSFESINTIKENLRHTKLEEQSQIIKGNSLRELENFAKINMSFDYIFIDPPYNDREILLKTLESLDNKSVLSSNGIIIVEHDREIEIVFNQFILIDERKYGKKVISFLKYDLGG